MDEQPIPEIVHILVMGLAGAGKSTFIKTLTGDPNIPIGTDLDSVTKDIRVYIKDYGESDRTYEIHLYDCPGFDDGSVDDLEILRNITKVMNNLCREGYLAGCLYLHDITRPRMSAAGERGIRVLEEMLGRDNWNNCTLVTTKWNCSNVPEDEESREQKLRTNDKYWKQMIQAEPKANIRRFLNTEESAMKILKPHLNKRFRPAVSLQMTDRSGPMLSLGQTEAGLVAGSIRQDFNQQQLDQAMKVLSQKWDEKRYQELIEELAEEKEKLIKTQKAQHNHRIVVRTMLYAGAITFTAVTFGLGAPTFTTPLKWEVNAREQKKQGAQLMAQLDEKIDKVKKGANINDAAENGSLPERTHEPPSRATKIEVASADHIPTAASEQVPATERTNVFAQTFASTMSLGKDLFAKTPKSPKSPKMSSSAKLAKAPVTGKSHRPFKADKTQKNNLHHTSSGQGSPTDGHEDDNLDFMDDAVSNIDLA